MSFCHIILTAWNWYLYIYIYKKQLKQNKNETLKNVKPLVSLLSFINGFTLDYVSII